MNPRSYEATSDEFQICSRPSSNLIISLQHLHTMLLKVSSSPKRTQHLVFHRYRQTSGFRVHFTHTFGGITSIQVYIFLRELDTFWITHIRTLKTEIIPVNTARNKSGNPPEQLRPENMPFFKIPQSNFTNHIAIYLH